MITEVALITISAVLFVQMGLSSAIQEFLNFRSRILSCCRCSTFWSVLAYCLVSKAGFFVSVATSFICAYVAQWLALLHDALALFYNSAYEYITKTDGASEDAEVDTDKPDETSATDEVSEM